jgi:hypothetical protein
MTEKAIFLVVIIALIIAGLMYREDFQGHRWGAFIWFGILGVALGRLLYFFIKKR